MKKKSHREWRLIYIAIFIVLCIGFGARLLFAPELSNAKIESPPASVEVSTPLTLDSNKKIVAYDELPQQAKETYALILKGGPFKYGQDGTTFGNYEGVLPPQPRNYYHEYTVKTPRVNHRGARRIVCGGKIKTRPIICYYTQDHYKNFQQIIKSPMD